MTVFALVTGALFRAPEQRTSKHGKALIRSNGRLFIPHHALRACGIDPDNLPEVRR
jgi:hypothetical protein